MLYKVPTPPGTKGPSRKRQNSECYAQKKTRATIKYFQQHYSGVENRLRAARKVQASLSEHMRP